MMVRRRSTARSPCSLRVPNMIFRHCTAVLRPHDSDFNAKNAGFRGPDDKRTSPRFEMRTCKAPDAEAVWSCRHGKTSARRHRRRYLGELDFVEWDSVLECDGVNCDVGRDRCCAKPSGSPFI